MDTILSFSEKENLLHIDTRSFTANVIEITVLNSLAEIIHKMKFIKGKHSISLSALSNGDYSVRLVAGNNVWVNKISIQHH